MGSIVWTLPAILDLQAIAEYIELDKPEAAKRLVQKVFTTVEKLQRFPKLGKVPKELEDLSNLQYRELIVPPCRIFYRLENQEIYIVAVTRTEKDFKIMG